MITKRRSEKPRRSGPATLEGRAVALANLEDPVTAGLKHGVKAADGNYMACVKCATRAACEAYQAGETCAIERAYVDERRAQLVTLAHVDPVLDGPALSVLLWQEVRILRASRYLAAEGELRPDSEGGVLEWQPLAKDVGKLVAGWLRSLQALSLTPAGRKAMADDGRGGPGAELAAAIRDIARAEAQKEAATVEGEVVDGGDPA